MNPDAGRVIGARVVAAVHWILIPGHIIGLALLIGGAGVGLVIINEWMKVRTACRQMEDKILRGAQVRSIKELREFLRNKVRDTCLIPINREYGLALPAVMQKTHILCTGGTQSGKSQALRAVARVARERGEPAIIPVLEAEFFEGFFDPEVDVLVNPFDARGVAWSVLAEIKNAAEIDTIVKSLVPADSGDEESWRERGRRLVAAFLSHVWSQGGTNADLTRLINEASEDELARALAGTSAAGLLREGNQKMRENAMATASTLVLPLLQGAPGAGVDSWSVTRWVHRQIALHERGERAGWLWITRPDQMRETMNPYMSVVSSLAIRAVMTAGINRERRIHYFFDEMGDVPVVGGITTALIRGAKYGLLSFGIVQSVSQLRERYGLEGATNLLSCFSTVFLFRANDPESGHWASRLIGQQQVKRSTTSESISGGSSRTGSGQGGSESRGRSRARTEQVAVESALLDSEFAELPALTCYLRLAGEAGAFGPLSVDFVPLPDGEPFFIPVGSDPQAKMVLNRADGGPQHGGARVTPCGRLLDRLGRLPRPGIQKEDA